MDELRTFVLTVKKNGDEIIMVIDDRDTLADTISHYSANGYNWTSRVAHYYPNGTLPPRPPKQQRLLD